MRKEILTMVGGITALVVIDLVIQNQILKRDLSKEKLKFRMATDEFNHARTLLDPEDDRKIMEEMFKQNERFYWIVFPDK